MFDWLIVRLIGWLMHSVKFDWLIDSSIDWLIHPFIDKVLDWLIDWLIDCDILILQLISYFSSRYSTDLIRFKCRSSSPHPTIGRGYRLENGAENSVPRGSPDCHPFRGHWAGLFQVSPHRPGRCPARPDQVYGLASRAPDVPEHPHGLPARQDSVGADCGVPDRSQSRSTGLRRFFSPWSGIFLLLPLILE